MKKVLCVAIALGYAVFLIMFFGYTALDYNREEQYRVCLLSLEQECLNTTIRLYYNEPKKLYVNDWVAYMQNETLDIQNDVLKVLNLKPTEKYKYEHNYLLYANLEFMQTLNILQGLNTWNWSQVTAESAYKHLNKGLDYINKAVNKSKE